ncbi:MAG: GntR family transcriptional regulator [Flavobacterium sp.]|nr:MAG: GntR family transcriptional regulator [Flavobacterium sp.]
MNYRLFINPKGTMTKVQQVVEGIRKDIEKGNLISGSRLPSITAFSLAHNIARETVEKAYNILKKEELVVSIPGRGIYTTNNIPGKLKILMVMNKISTYKKEIYESFLERLGARASVDIKIHHYDPLIFKEIIEKARGQYHYYVIMPHFFGDANPSTYMPTIESIMPSELLILDKQINMAGDYRSVYQDFHRDIYEAMESAIGSFDKYTDVKLIFPLESHHPIEIIDGIKLFCIRRKKTLEVHQSSEDLKLEMGQLWIALTEAELGALVKLIRGSELEMGRDIGVISFNETVLKELLDITVISTDFRGMGIKAADLVLGNLPKKIRNEFSFIPRGSL